MERRNFLKISALAGAGLMVQVRLSAEPTVANGPFQPNLLVRIDPDNTITFSLTKTDFGQGTATGFPMIFADELGADLEKMKVINADYNKGFSHTLQGITGGSNSTGSCWMPLREAAAVTRELLIRAAAGQWKVPEQDCYTENSKVICKTDSRTITFGELTGIASQLPVPEKARLKSPEEFKYIGKSVGNLRSASIVSGKEIFSLDFATDNMLYASIERSPVHLGKLKSIDDKEARKVTGVVDVVKIDQVVKPVSVGVPGWNFFYPYTVEDGVAVVASSTWAAMQGRKALKLQWDDGVNASASVDKIRQQVRDFDQTKLEDTRNIGNVTDVRGAKSVAASYEIPFIPHCPMEPNNATAFVKGNTCELWVGTQFPKRFVEEVSTATGIPVDNITCHVLPTGGAFGRKWEPDYIVEAAMISKAMQRPVKLTWTREDDTTYSYFHSFQQDNHSAVLNDKNEVVAWSTDQFNFSKFPQGSPWNPYSLCVENYRSRKADLPSPVETGPWRSVGEHKDTMTIESFVDELAQAAAKDPLQFRLELLKKPLVVPPSQKDAERWVKSQEHDRDLTRQVLELAAEKAGWGSKKNLGIAAANFRSHCAQVAEVEVTDDILTVRKITLAIHCGTVVNPGYAETQLEGAVIWALQALLYGGVEIQDGKVIGKNFDKVKMIRINKVPEIAVHFVKSNDAPKGVGEPGVPALAPAVLNAIFAATGKRIRKIPVLPSDLK